MLGLVRAQGERNSCSKDRLPGRRESKEWGGLPGELWVDAGVGGVCAGTEAMRGEWRGQP